jgi:hypothetical protein
MIQICLGTVGRQKNIIGINKNQSSLQSKILCENVLTLSEY